MLARVSVSKSFDQVQPRLTTLAVIINYLDLNSLGNLFFSFLIPNNLSHIYYL